MEAAGLLPPQLPPLGSVGLTAVAAALRLTKGTVMIAGLDFAYKLDAYHGRSTPSRDDQLRKATRLRGLIDPAPAFRAHVESTWDKVGGRIRSDPALRGYRDLFTREFAATGRIFDAGTQGLELGIPRLGTEEALALLMANRDGDRALKERKIVSPADHPAGDRAAPSEAVIAYVGRELERLGRLRDALSGKENMLGTELDRLVDECDYLWAHFPECAGADGIRPPLENLSFLKRVRAEIEPFAKAFTLTKGSLTAREAGAK